jgi:hypothetical protein
MKRKIKIFSQAIKNEGIGEGWGKPLVRGQSPKRKD